MEVAVVGLGAVGVQTLWQLSMRHGVTVHGFDSVYPGHPFAGAGGESRLYRNCEVSDLGYVPIIQRADELWRELETVSSRRLRRLNGVLLLGESDNPQIQTALESADQIGKPVATLSSAAIREKYPQFAVGPGDIGVFDEEGGVISPELTVSTTASLAAQNGAHIHEYSPIRRVESVGKKVRLHTDKMSQAFDRVVVACGGWTTMLLPELQTEVVTKRLTSAWFVGESDSYLQGLPPFMRTAPHYCYGIPTPDGAQVKLGLGFNDHLSTGNADEVPRELDGVSARKEIDRFGRIIEGVLPGLNPRPVRFGTYIESYTRSMREYLRILPDRPNITVLTGFSGHGFKLAPAIGEIGAQLVTEGSTAIAIDFLEAAAPVFEIEDVATGRTSHNPLVATTRTLRKPV